ncbi:unnamed protein product [Phaeothamnion confervicola]
MALELLERPLEGSEGALQFPATFLRDVEGKLVDVRSLSRTSQLFFLVVELRRALGGTLLVSEGLSLARLVDGCLHEPELSVELKTALVPYLRPRRYHGIGAGGAGWGGRPSSSDSPPHPALASLRYTRRVSYLLYACDCSFVVLFRLERSGGGDGGGPHSFHGDDAAAAAALREARALLPDCPWVDLADPDHAAILDELHLGLPTGRMAEAVFGVDTDGFVGFAQLIGGGVGADLVYVQLTQHLLAARRRAEHAAGFACQMADFGAGGLWRKSRAQQAAADDNGSGDGGGGSGGGGGRARPDLSNQASQALPSDLLMQVLEYVGPRQAWRAAQVCGLWQHLLRCFLSEQLRRQSEGLMLRLPRLDTPDEFLVLVPPPPAYSGEGSERAPWDAYPPATLCPLYALTRVRRDARALLAVARVALGEEETVHAITELEEEGNAHFRNGQLSLALECYIDALEMVPLTRRRGRTRSRSGDGGGSNGGGSGGASAGVGSAAAGEDDREADGGTAFAYDVEDSGFAEAAGEAGGGFEDAFENLGAAKCGVDSGAAARSPRDDGRDSSKRQRHPSGGVAPPSRLLDVQTTLLTAAAAVHLRLGRRSKAMECCTWAVELNPTHTQALLQRGRLHILLGKHKLALLDLQRLLAVPDLNRGICQEASSLLYNIRGWS